LTGRGNLGISYGVMTSQRIQSAMDRIDRALARIETQAALASHSPAPDAPTNAKFVARHEALRESVTTTISQLDALIEGLAP
jgi:hypothetical protein